MRLVYHTLQGEMHEMKAQNGVSWWAHDPSMGWETVVQGAGQHFGIYQYNFLALFIDPGACIAYRCASPEHPLAAWSPATFRCSFLINYLSTGTRIWFGFASPGPGGWQALQVDRSSDFTDGAVVVAACLFADDPPGSIRLMYRSRKGWVNDSGPLSGGPIRLNSGQTADLNYANLGLAYDGVALSLLDGGKHMYSAWTCSRELSIRAPAGFSHGLVPFVAASADATTDPEGNGVTFQFGGVAIAEYGALVPFKNGVEVLD